MIRRSRGSGRREKGIHHLTLGREERRNQAAPDGLEGEEGERRGFIARCLGERKGGTRRHPLGKKRGGTRLSREKNMGRKRRKEELGGCRKEKKENKKVEKKKKEREGRKRMLVEVVVLLVCLLGC